MGGAAAYSSSVTWSPQLTRLPVSSACCMAMWVMNRIGAAPCQWLSPGLEDDPVAGRMTSMGPPRALAEADALQDPDRLAVRVRVPGGAGARREVDARSADPRFARRCRDAVDIDVAGEPVAWPTSGLADVSCDLHTGLRVVRSDVGRWTTAALVRSFSIRVASPPCTGSRRRRPGGSRSARSCWTRRGRPTCSRSCSG